MAEEEKQQYPTTLRGSKPALATSAIRGLSEMLGGYASFKQYGQNAGILKKLGALNAEEIRIEGRSVEGAQRAAATTPGYGSAADIIAADAVENELAALREKWGFDVQAASAKAAARAALISGISSSVSTVLGGYQRYKGQAGGAVDVGRRYARTNPQW